MEETMILLLKAAAILTLLYGFYMIAFKEDTHFKAKRMVLLSIMVWSCFVPFLSFHVLPKQVMTSTDKGIQTNHDVLLAPATSYDLWSILFVVYAIGLFFFLSTLIFQITSILRVIIKHKVSPIENGNIIITDELPNPSSFGKYVFLKSRDIDDRILRHELGHVNKNHTIDIVASHVFKSILWFHPFAHMLETSVKENHEYECDQELVTTLDDPQSYCRLMLENSHPSSKNSLINKFSSFTKKRIIMISKTNLKQGTRLIYLLSIPMFLGVLALFSFKTYPVYIPISANGTNDTIPPYTYQNQNFWLVDTIITFDDVTRKETVEIVKNQVTEKRLEELYPEYLEKIDTVITFDFDTKIEKTIIVKNKIKKAYDMLIQEEFKQANPDYKKIDEWREKGK